VDELIDEANEDLKVLETAVVAAIFASLDLEFNLLLEGISAQLQSGQLLLEGSETRALELVDPLLPGDTDEFLDLFERLLLQSTTAGLALAGELSRPVVPSPVAVSIPAESLELEARKARGYLEQQGRSFTDTVTGLISGGFIAGLAVSEILKQLRRRLDVVKSRTEVIVRTESLKAFNKAGRSYYVQNNVQLVVYYATPDDRTCPYCAAQAGRVFKLGAITVPRHPNCRCVLAPYSTNQYESSAPYDRNRRNHRKEVLSYARSKGIQLDEGPAYFEQLRPLPTRKDGQEEG